MTQDWWWRSRFFSGQAFIQMPQTIGNNDFTPVLSSPIPVASAEYQSAPNELASRGHPPQVFPSLWVQMHAHLPAAIPEQALHWWCPVLTAESTLGDGHGIYWTFFCSLKPSSQQLNLPPWRPWWSGKCACLWSLFVLFFWFIKVHFHGKEGLCN